MSARNFYIMQSAVSPMQSELPCYTPLTNHATDVHTVPLVFASDYDRDTQALREGHRKHAAKLLTETGLLRDERDTLRTATQRLEGEYSKLLESNVLDAETIDRLEGEVARLREALNTAKYRIEQGRVWNGMGWSLTGLHPHGQQKALDAIDAALRGNGGDV